MKIISIFAKYVFFWSNQLVDSLQVSHVLVPCNTFSVFSKFHDNFQLKASEHGYQNGTSCSCPFQSESVNAASAVLLAGMWLEETWQHCMLGVCMLCALKSGRSSRGNQSSRSIHGDRIQMLSLSQSQQGGSDIK